MEMEGFGGSEDEDEDVDELAELTRQTARLAGKKGKAAAKKGGDRRNAMYNDFFGDGGRGGSGDGDEEQEEDGNEPDKQEDGGALSLVAQTRLLLSLESSALMQCSLVIFVL